MSYTIAWQNTKKQKNSTRTLLNKPGFSFCRNVIRNWYYFHALMSFILPIYNPYRKQSKIGETKLKLSQFIFSN